MRAYQPRSFPRTPQDQVFGVSMGEYPVYDTLIYDLQGESNRRNDMYREACRQHAPGRVCLDLGTGAHLIWARACADAGASHVYAIEVIDESYQAGKRLLAKLGLESRITLLHGLSNTVELPERVDVLVSEIIGCIGGSEGAAAILADARARFLKPDGHMIPELCVTHVAGVELPDALVDDPCFALSEVRYLKKTFDVVGHPFDIRLCIDDETCSGWRMTDAGIFENMDFSTEVPVDYSIDTTVRVTRAGRLDGVALWIELSCTKGATSVDSFSDLGAWPPVYFPLFHPGVAVTEGDELRMTCIGRLSDDGVHPDYAIRGELHRRGHAPIAFSFESSHHGRSFRGDALYQQLFQIA